MTVLLYLFIFLCFFSIIISCLSFAPWVPTRKKDLRRIFELADLKPGEVFYDLGCGNGRLAIYAAKNFQARAIGLELALPLYLVCAIRKLFSGNKLLKFKLQNLFNENLSGADVIYIFGMPDKLKIKLREKLERELKPGARVITYAFPIKDWMPERVDKPARDDVSIYLYFR